VFGIAKIDVLHRGISFISTAYGSLRANSSSFSQSFRRRFGWPLSLARLALRTSAGWTTLQAGCSRASGSPQFPSLAAVANICDAFDPSVDPVGGDVFETTAQDQGLTLALRKSRSCPSWPAYLAPWASTSTWETRCRSTRCSSASHGDAGADPGGIH